LKSITRKTLLYKSGVEYADYGLNHVEGCSHGCTFPCYAMMMKKRCGIIKSYNEWVQPKIVSNSLELLDNELPRLKNKIQNVFLCFSTDPFMYEQPEVNDLTLKIIERLNNYNIKVISVSKGIYPKELTNTKKYGSTNDYGSTVVSLDERYRKIYEPGAAPLKERVKALEQLHNAGLSTWVSMEPYPTPNIVEQDLHEILNEIKFVDKIVFGKWNYSKKVSNYQEYKEFYNSTAAIVIDFCKRNGTDFHIKDGTISDKSIEKNSSESDTLREYINDNLNENSSSANMFSKRASQFKLPICLTK
jgi:DNA repair photolyase